MHWCNRLFTTRTHGGTRQPIAKTGHPRYVWPDTWDLHVYCSEGSRPSWSGNIQFPNGLICGHKYRMIRHCLSIPPKVPRSQSRSESGSHSNNIYRPWGISTNGNSFSVARVFCHSLEGKRRYSQISSGFVNYTYDWARIFDPRSLSRYLHYSSSSLLARLLDISSSWLKDQLNCHVVGHIYIYIYTSKMQRKYRRFLEEYSR